MKTFRQNFGWLLAATLCVTACKAPGLSGGGGSRKATKKESGGEGTDTSTSTGKSEQSDGATATDANQTIGANDAGDFAFPEDVAGSYLTCQFATATTNSARFSCAVYNGNAPDQRHLSGVTQGTLLGEEATKVAQLSAVVDPMQAGRISVVLQGTGNAPTAKPVEFGLSLVLEFADGTTSTVGSPFKLYVPDLVYGPAGCPQGYVGEGRYLPDGRTFYVCAATAGGGNAIEAMWTKLTGTDGPSYAPSFTPETAGKCDLKTKTAATFTPCGCTTDEGWVKGTVSFTTNPFPNAQNICLLVETQYDVFGVPRNVYGITH